MPDYEATSSSTVAINTQTTQNITNLWGPKRDSLSIVIPITIIYAIIFLIGIIGNVSTCVVIARNRSMHTATNYYLFSLAISDLLLLISGLPSEMYYIWFKYPYVFGEVFCIVQGFAAETSANATVLTITAFTVERYVAICHPFLSHTLSRLSRAIKFIVGIWTVALCFAVPQALEFGVVYERSEDGDMVSEEYSACTVKRVVIPHAFEISTCLFFVAPMTLITVLYLLIGLQLHRSSMMARDGGTTMGATESSENNMASTVDGCGPCSRNSRKNIAKNAQTKATKHVVKMLVAVVVAFFICWAPFHAQRLLAIYGYGGEEGPTQDVITAYKVLTYVSGVLYYLSTTVNPVLYHIMSHKFREAFKVSLGCCIGRRRARGGRLYSVLSRSSRGVNGGDTSSSGCREESFGAGQGSGSRHSNSLRFLEADVARQERRPLVVSFRRKHAVNPPTDASGLANAQVCVSVVERRASSRRRWCESRAAVPVVSSVVYRAPRVSALLEAPASGATVGPAASDALTVPSDPAAAGGVCEGPSPVGSEGSPDPVVSDELTLYMDELKQRHKCAA
ncbi:pyrokinin-1 receptor-like [Hetaerina americana]|uniref:pyrokinin-1 receptor-like n=1 Tax=Hetaerina americana TaxID=62018 RepID=UPI003A7F27B5